MKIYLKDGNYTLAKDFPMSVFEIRDTLDRLRKFQSREVLFRLSEFGNTELPQSLCGKEFSADIYKLNLFAERYEKLEYPEAEAFKSLLKANPESSFDDMLLMTYGLDSGRKEGEITSYGAISGRGQELYSAITVKSEQQLTEDISEEFSDEELEEDESGDFEMGGMLL